MELGLFQLENLILTRSRFCFLDVRAKPELSSNRAFTEIMKHAETLAVADVPAHLNKLNLPKEQPVILVCETGKASQAAAQRLESLGYSNTYVVAGGTRGLLAELSSTK